MSLRRSSSPTWVFRGTPRIRERFDREVVLVSLIGKWSHCSSESIPRRQIMEVLGLDRVPVLYTSDGRCSEHRVLGRTPMGFHLSRQSVIETYSTEKNDRSFG